MKSSNIGGQAVMEGIMMRHKDKYSIAVRRPDNGIELKVEDYKCVFGNAKFLKYPLIRGVVSFVDSLVVGTKCLMYSAEIAGDEEDEEDKQKNAALSEEEFAAKKAKEDKQFKWLLYVTVAVSIVVSVAAFMLLPYALASLCRRVGASEFAVTIVEAFVKLALFMGYMLLISRMKDIQRTFMYHGAEHKCINCIENGARLTVENVMNSSRYHKRCGTSFLFIVMFISVVFFIFIRVDNTALQIVIRLLLVPVIAGVSYEFIRWAGRNDNGFTVALSRPGMWLQKLTTREPDEDMVEVAIKAVEEVFDWEAFLKEYYQTSLDMEADIKAAEAKLALTGELIHKPKKTRKIDAREVAMAETLKSVESKSLAGSDKDSSKSDTENGNSDTLNSDTDVVKTDTTDTGNVEAEPDTVNAVDDTDNGNSDEDNAKSDSEALQENAESDDKAQESTEADNETSQENADDDLPEGFEIEDHYETVEKIKTETGSKYAFTTENVQEDIDASENMSVEEVEAAFEIEETEQEEENISELKSLLKGKTTSIAGPSGVGKSSLINLLQSEVKMETGSISKKIDRGKHTTRHSELIVIGEDSYIMDTPGFSSLYVNDFEKEDLKYYFPEFTPFEGQCKFNGCDHIHEPGCAVKEAVEEGKIHKIRYEDYTEMYRELKERKRY